MCCRQAFAAVFTTGTTCVSIECIDPFTEVRYHIIVLCSRQNNARRFPSGTKAPPLQRDRDDSSSRLCCSTRVVAPLCCRACPLCTRCRRRRPLSHSPVDVVRALACLVLFDQACHHLPEKARQHTGANRCITFRFEFYDVVVAVQTCTAKR